MLEMVDISGDKRKTVHHSDGSNAKVRSWQGLRPGPGNPAGSVQSPP